MLEYRRHLPQQWPVIAAMGRTLGRAVAQRLGRSATAAADEVFEVLPPRPRQLIDDYLKHVGAEPGDYSGTLPAHLFPQWSFPLQARCLQGLQYPLARILNAGCKLTMYESLPDHQPLEVTARVTGVDDNGRRVLLRQQITTRAANAPQGVVAEMAGLIPLRRGSPSKDPKVVSSRAQRIDTWHLSRGNGLDFALLTGDFNPVHWIPLYARGMGFKSNILHGFSTMARAIESLRRHVLRAQPLRVFDCHFTRPLVLPATVHVFIEGQTLFVGDAPGERAYLIASYATEI